MIRRPLLAPASLIAVLLTQGPAGAAPVEQWEATSTTAMSITGNVTFAPDRIIFQNGAALPLMLVGHAAAFDAQGQRVPADLYKVTAPADPLLLRGNRLCGGGPRQLPVTYIAVWTLPASGGRQGRGIDVFSSAAPPQPNGQRAGDCGTYFYETAATPAAAPSAPVTDPVDCPDVVAGHPLGVIDFYDGPPEDGYLDIPNQPGKRDIWNSLDKVKKGVVVLCHYQGGATRESRIPPGTVKYCTALRAPNDVHTGLTCQ